MKTTGSSLDLHHHRHSPVHWAIRHPLCHRFTILLGRRFPSTFAYPSYSSRRHIHSRFPIFSSNSKNRSWGRSRSTPYKSLLPHLSAAQSSGNAAGVHGAVDGESYISDFLPTPLRGVTHLYPGMVGGCCIHLCFVLGMHWQHIHDLRIGERPV